jgi:hypothetical protein
VSTVTGQPSVEINKTYDLLSPEHDFWHSIVQNGEVGKREERNCENLGILKMFLECRVELSVCALTDKRVSFASAFASIYIPHRSCVMDRSLKPEEGKKERKRNEGRTEERSNKRKVE